MESNTNAAPWKAAVSGALVCGIAGPIIPSTLLTLGVAFKQPTVGSMVGTIEGLPMVWVFALIPFGIPALLLGACGGLLILRLSRSARSRGVLVARTGTIGIFFGAVVVLLPSLWGWGPIENLLWTSPIGATTGFICAFLVLRSLRTKKLLGSFSEIAR